MTHRPEDRKVLMVSLTILFYALWVLSFVTAVAWAMNR